MKPTTDRKTHELKCIQPYFEEVFNERKPFEIRKNDRDYRVGDRVIQKEFDPSNNSYSGREKDCGVITYILTDYEAIMEEYVVFGLSFVPSQEVKQSVNVITDEQIKETAEIYLRNYYGANYNLAKRTEEHKLFAHKKGYIDGYNAAVKDLNPPSLTYKEREPDEIKRVEVIDANGRAFVRYFKEPVKLSFQDENKTLKIFSNESPSQSIEPVKDYFEEYQFEAGRVEDLQAEISQLKYQLSLFPEISPSQSTESPDSDKKAVICQCSKTERMEAGEHQKWHCTKCNNLSNNQTG